MEHDVLRAHIALETLREQLARFERVYILIGERQVIGPEAYMGTDVYREAAAPADIQHRPNVLWLVHTPAFDFRRGGKVLREMPIALRQQPSVRRARAGHASSRLRIASNSANHSAA